MVDKIVLMSRIELTTKDDVPEENFGPLLMAVEQYLNQMVIDLSDYKEFSIKIFPRFHFQFKEGMVNEQVSGA